MVMPTFEEMVAAMNSPLSPVAITDVMEEDLSTEEMIRAIYEMVRSSASGNGKPATMGGAGVGRTGTMLDSSYDSSTSTYDGQAATAQYNGGLL